MNQDLAKVPNSKESHWEFIDIFLFRNGEHAAPPRKYHFKYEELDSWENILKNIAQTQYGSKESVVDIYTINGEKVTTPIEITNKNFYVTVLPQDTFIPAGYKDYLLKASRSREKRQGKNLNLIEDILPETAGQTGDKIIAKNVDTKLPNSSIANGINESENPPASQDNNVTASKMLGQTLQKTRNNSPKTTTNSQLLKRSNQPPVIVTKAPLKKPDHSSKKNLKLSSGRILNKEPVPTNFNTLKTKSKDISRLGKFNSLISNLKKVETNPEPLNEVKYTPTIIDENNTTTESPIIDDVIYDKELIVVKNPDSVIIDANKGILSRPIITLSDIPSITTLQKKSTTNVTFDKAGNIKPDIAIYSVQTGPNKDEVDNYISSDNTGSQTINSNSKNDDIQATDNIFAIIDKGDVVHFNLKLELKKCDGVIRAQYTTDDQVHSVTENQSQLKSNSIFRLFQETKANVTKEVQIDDKNAKIIIVSCSCCDHENFNEILHKIETSYPDDNSDNKYVFLVCDPDNEKNMQSCDQEPTKKSENTDVAKLSVVDGLEKVKAETSIIKISAKTKTNGTDVEKLDIKTSRTQFKLRNNTSGKDEQVITNETQNYGVKDKSMKSTVNSEHSETTEIEIQNTESFNLRKNDSNMTKQFKDNSTQTEWSSLLLEAKRHEDGRYSFHIPPLSVLKYYFW